VPINKGRRLAARHDAQASTSCSRTRRAASVKAFSPHDLRDVRRDMLIGGDIATVANIAATRRRQTRRDDRDRRDETPGRGQLHSLLRVTTLEATQLPPASESG